MIKSGLNGQKDIHKILFTYTLNLPPDFKPCLFCLDRNVAFTKLCQSASKHGRRTFPYNAMRELICNGQLWASRGSEAAPQLQGRIARAFSSNNLVNTLEITAAIQHNLAAAQSLGSQDYTIKSLE